MLIKKTAGLPQVFTNHKALKLCVRVMACVGVCIFSPPSPILLDNELLYSVRSLSQSFAEFEEIGTEELLEVWCCTDN